MSVSPGAHKAGDFYLSSALITPFSPVVYVSISRPQLKILPDAVQAQQLTLWLSAEISLKEEVSDNILTPEQPGVHQMMSDSLPARLL